MVFVNGVAAQILLDPGTGGKSILQEALRPGDLILSTTNSIISKAIRELTGGGDASHVRLYIGEGDVIESQKDGGVRQMSMKDVISGDKVTVALRMPDLDSDKANDIVLYAMSEIGKAYDRWGAISQGRFSFRGNSYRLYTGNDNDTFYCSELITSVYEKAGAPLTLSTPKFDSPNDIVALQWFGELEYVGHLKSSF